MSEAIEVNVEGIGLIKEVLFELFLLFLPNKRDSNKTASENITQIGPSTELSC